MNTRSTRRDLPEEIVDTSEQRQTGSVLDELIEQRLRTIMDQNELQIQQAERFKQIISQYEERIGKIEEKQPEIDSMLQRVNSGIAVLVERIETIEMRGKVWDMHEGKVEASQAEIMTHVQELFTRELKLVDAKYRDYVGHLEYQNQEL
jgi:hypothetical protein